MKKTRILSLLLCLSLFCAMLIPSTMAEAVDGESEDSGMKVNKTATCKDDDSYTITLEAYATGEKTTTVVEKDVPTDIVLVLDLSSSMTEDIGTVSYSTYSNKNNEELYALRHNGGGANLWYKENDAYYSVSVTAEERTVVYTAAQGNYSNSQLHDNRNNLYVKIGEEYIKIDNVSIEESKGKKKTYTYTYTYNNTTNTVKGTYSSSKGNTTDTLPTFSNGGVLYVATKVDNTNATYTYTYTVGTETKTITSTGGNNAPNGVTFYSRSTSTSGGGARLAALKTACTNFVEAVAAKCNTADGKTVSHRIAVVGFNSSATCYTGTSTNNALLDMKDSTNVTSVKSSIESLSTSQGTKPSVGLNLANSIFAANSIPEGETRNRVVVFFTDGYPSTSGADNFDKDLANNAINAANIAKNTYGATVYSVAVIQGADPTSAGNSNGTNQEKVNWFLQTVSNNNGTPNSPSYYLSASDAASLNSIFKQISDQIDYGGSPSKLDSSAVVKDVISPQFTLPPGTTASDITLKTYKYNGSSFDAENAWTENTDVANNVTATVDATTGTVSVTGFDFSANWCGSETKDSKTTYRGNKLVISFKVKAKEGFLGGNDVYTNSSAGVYADTTSTNPVVVFNQPTVNVPIKAVTVNAADKNVYLLGSVTAEQLKSGAKVEVGNVSLDLSKANDTAKPYGLEPWQTAYVDITVAIKDKAGKTISEKLENLTDDETYTVEVTVAPKKSTPESTEGISATTQTGSNTGHINVFQPELTFKDSEAYYGESIPDNNNYSGNKVDAETWKHGTINSTSVTMLGEKPTLVISYTPDSQKIEDSKYTKQDVPVKATVKIGNTDVSQYTTFEHQNCSPDCGWTVPTQNGDPAFLIHVKTCTLTITKSGGAEGESYVFDVKKDGNKYSEVTIEGSSSQTIYELPVGTYTIVENIGWSWRYTANNGGSVTLSAVLPTGTITCTNTKNSDFWLNGFSAVVKNIYGKAPSN